MQNQTNKKTIEDILFERTYLDEDKNTIIFENTSDKFFWNFRTTDGLDDILGPLDDELIREQEVFFYLLTSKTNYLAFYSEPFKSIRDGIYFKLNINELLNENPNITNELKEFFINEYGTDEAEYYNKTIDAIFDLKNYEEQQQLTSLDFYKSYQNRKAEEIKKAYLLGIGLTD